jgi:hypothetical protein
MERERFVRSDEKWHHMTKIVNMNKAAMEHEKVNIIVFNAIEFIENWHATCTSYLCNANSKTLLEEKNHPQGTGGSND